MAIYHCSMKNGGVGKGKSHAQYIGAEGKYAQKSDMVFCENGNLPDFANGDAVQFFKSADEHERKNGRTYKEFELTLPRELDFDQNLGLVKSFMDEAKLQNQPYLLAIHSGKNGDNPHAHLMFSERPNADFSEDVFFKRNGSKKDRTFNEKSYLSESRKAWEVQINQALEQAGIDEKVSCETLKKQGIDRLPQPKIGFAAQAILARGGNSNRAKRFEEVAQFNIEKAITFEHDKNKVRQLKTLESSPALQSETLQRIAEIKGLKSDISKLEKQEIAEPRTYKNLQDFVSNSPSEIGRNARTAKQNLDAKKREVENCKWYQPFQKMKLESQLPELKMTFQSCKKEASEKAKALNKSRKVDYQNKVDARAQKLEQANRKVDDFEQQLENRFGLKSSDLESAIQDSDVNKNQEMELQMQRDLEWKALEKSCQQSQSNDFEM